MVWRQKSKIAFYQTEISSTTCRYMKRVYEKYMKNRFVFKYYLTNPIMKLFRENGTLLAENNFPII